MLQPVRSLAHTAKFLSAVLLLGLGSQAWALNKVITVSATAGRGDFTTIQAAVNNCDPLQDVCTIGVLDLNTILEAPVWIEGKANITIQGQTTSGAKPSIQFDPALYTLVANPNAGQQAQVPKLFTLSWLQISGTADPERPAGWLMWPYIGAPDGAAATNGPIGKATDTSSQYSSSGFQHNGMIVIKKSSNITIRGLKLVAQPVIFQNQGIWNNMYDVLFGTVGINLMQSKAVTIDGNDISGFFTGIYNNGRNPGGMFGIANPNDVDVQAIVPLSRYGQVGNHNIERNYFHDNWWCMYGESIWDLASRIHHNVAYNNMNKSFQYLDSLKVAKANSNEMNNQTGGFYYMKDEVLAADRMYNNTILRSPIVIGFGYFRAGTQEMFYNNVVRVTPELANIKTTDDHQLIQNYASTAWYNTVQQQPAVSTTYSNIMDNQNIHDATLSGVYTAGQSCAAGCNLAATYTYVSQVQPQFAWLNWQMAQGVTDSVSGTALLFNGKPLASNPAITGYAGRNFPISTNNGYAAWGLVNAMTGGATPAVPVNGAGAITRDNLFAFKLPTLLDTIKPTTAAQIKIDTTYTQLTPSNLNNLSPAWDSVTVQNSVLNQAWYVDDQKNPDGTRGNRGAFCFDTATGATSFGCTPSGVVLALDDQKIVSVKGTGVLIPMIISQTNGVTGAPSGGYSGFQVDSVYYYKDLPWGNLSTAVQTGPDLSKVGYPLPQRLTGTWNGTSGSALSVTLPAALSATEDVVRFDVFMSAIDPSTGARVTTMGIYFYRKVTNQLSIQFCSDAACTQVITSARVGDKVYMKTTVTDASGNPVPSMNVVRVYVSPNPGEINLLTGNLVDTSQFLNSFTGSFTTPLDFQSTGNISVTVTGLVGAATSTIGVVGNGSITVKPGLPYAVQFTNPETYQVTKCGGNPSDTTLGCNEVQGVQADQGTLVVYDKYGNTVDTAATVSVNITGAFQGKIASATALAGGTTKLGATVTAVASGIATVNVQTSPTGQATFWIYGDPGPSGAGLYAQNIFPWVELTGSVVQATYPVAAPDTAYARLMPPTGHLAWKSPSQIDTFILTPRPVVLFLTKDGATVDAGNPNANSAVSISATSSFIQFFADSLLTQPLAGTVNLSGGTVRFWVQATKPTAGFDTLLGQIVGLSTTNPGLPARFSNPPQPPTPVLKSAVFMDASCTGAPDSIVVKFDPAGSNRTLKTDARIDSITITSASGAVVRLDSTAVNVSSDSTYMVITLPSSVRSKFTVYDPAATIQVTAALVRLPAADTIVTMNATPLAVTDGIGPRPVAATIVENDVANTPDTLKVQFSEPVNYTGLAFPFQIIDATGAVVPAPGMAVTSSTGSGTANMTFVVTGNNGFLVAGEALAINPGTGLSDLAGNGGRYSQCSGDTAQVVLVPIAVPIVSAWISDVNGDGMADQITVVFRRPFQKATEASDNLVISNWPGAPANTTLLWSAHDSIGPATYTFPISFPEGATVGGNVDGSGSITLNQGPIRKETSALVDSVPPVAVGVAKLSHGLTKDTLTVTYSEPVKAGSGSITLGKKSSSGTDAPLALVGTGSGTVWTYVITPGYVKVGDSLRMSITSSALVSADNGEAPAGSGNAPYVPVVGGDGIPDSAIVLDLNGDGTADAVRLVYASPLNGNPSFTFTWGGKTVTVDSTAYGKSLQGTNGGIIKVSGFPALVTSGPGSGTTQSLVSGSATTLLPFPLIDGMAPVLDSVYVTYGQAEGAPDTVRFKVSEPFGTLPTVSSLLTIGRNGTALPFVPSDPTAKPLLVNSTTYQIVCDSCVDGSGFYGLPGYGDSAKLMKGVPDAVGNHVGDTSRWVPVLTGPHPVRYFAGVYPSGGVFVVTQGSTQPAVIQNLPEVTAWVLPVTADSTGSWSAVDATTNGGTSNLDAATAKGALLGVTLTLNTSFDGQFIFYDNLGVYAGKIDVTTDIKDLTSKGLVSPTNGKYTMVIGLHDSNARTLASGVYMARVISFSEQTVNGVMQRVMIQNKLFKFGYKNTGK